MTYSIDKHKDMIFIGESSDHFINAKKYKYISFNEKVYNMIDEEGKLRTCHREYLMDVSEYREMIINDLIVGYS